MLFKRGNKGESGIQDLSFLQIVIIILGALAISIFMMEIQNTDYGNKWIVSVFLGLVGGIVLLLVDDRKTLLFGVLAFLSFLSFDIVLRDVGNVRIHKVSPLTFSADDIVLGILYLIWWIDIFKKRGSKEKIIFFYAPLIFFILFMGWSLIGAKRSFIKNMAFNRETIYIRQILLVFYLINNINSFKHIKAILIGAAFAMMLHSSIGFAQKATGRVINIPLIGGRSEEVAGGTAERSLVTSEGKSEERIEGAAGHPNAMARLLSLYLPVFLFLVLFYKLDPLLKLILSASALMSLLAIALTLSRSGWIALYVSLAIGFLIVAFQLKKVFTLVLLAIVLQAIVFLPIVLTENPISQRIFNAEESFNQQSGSAFARVAHAEIAWNYIKHNPILGVGMMNFEDFLRVYDNTKYQIAWTHPTTIHITYLYYACEDGIPAMIFIVLMYGFIMYYGLKAGMTHPNFLARLIAIGLVSGILSSIIALTYTIYIFSDLKSIWLPVGIISSIYLRPHLFYSKQLK